MAEYKNIKGFEIQSLDSDPSNPIVGQVWYNSTTQTLKGTTAGAAGTWGSGGNLNTARSSSAGAGIQTAGLVYGGKTNITNNELYNGSAWTEV